MPVHLAVAGDVFVGVFLCCPFPLEMSWMRSGTELSQSQRVFLPTFEFKKSRSISDLAQRSLGCYILNSANGN